MTQGNGHDRPFQTMGDAVRQLREDVDSLEEWRAELRGAFLLVRLTLGVSLFSAVVSIVALISQHVIA